MNAREASEGHLIHPLGIQIWGLRAEGTGQVRQQTGTNCILSWDPEGSYLCSLMMEVSPWPQGLCTFVPFTSQRRERLCASPMALQVGT